MPCILPTISSLAVQFYLEAKTADVHFTFDNSPRKKNKREVRIPAHKILLNSRSDVFHAMFYGPLTEKGDVHIVDATIEAFKEFLKLFYFDRPKVDMVYVPDVLRLIRKYNVAGCSSYCDESLKESMTLDNVCWIYELALEFQLESSKKRCEEKISLEAAEIFQTNDFLDRSYGTVLQIVALNNFACDEYAVFRACISWAKEECHRVGLDTADPLNLRNQLQDILYRIRFRSMDATRLGQVIGDYHSLLNGDELADVALLALFDSQPKTTISKEYRNNAWDSGELLSCDFLTSTESRMKKLQRVESVTFSSSERIVLRQIRLGNLYVDWTPVNKDPANLKLEIVRKVDDNLVIYNTEYPNESVKFGHWFTLPKMIFIEPLVDYEIRVDYWDITDDNYCANGRKDSSAVVHREVDEGRWSYGRLFGRKKITINVSGNAALISAMKFCRT